jgi:hypothetical protein
MTSISDAVLFLAGRPILCLLAGFLIAFIMTRGVTCLIRAQRGPFADVSLGALHLHHMVWGAGLVLVSGIVEFAFTPDEPWNAGLALAFGIGSALMLDEFALMIYLRDVYWSAEGRRSIDAVITMLVVLIAIPVASGLLPAASLPLVAFAALAYVALLAVCLLKGKLFTALAGAFMPVLLPIAAVRLARPGSAWALISYRRNPRKQLRAAARFGTSAAHEKARHRILDAFRGSLLSVSEGCETPRRRAREGRFRVQADLVADRNGARSETLA